MTSDLDAASTCKEQFEYIDSLWMDEFLVLPEWTVPRQAKHVDVIADQHDVANLDQISCLCPFKERMTTLFATIWGGLGIWDTCF